MTENNLTNAGFIRRALSFIVDLFVLNIIIGFPFSKVFSKLNYSDIMSVETLPNEVYIAVFIASILAMVYFAFFEYYLGQTPGQMLYKIKVISLKQNSALANAKKNKKQKSDIQNLTLTSALLRNCFILPFFPFYVFWIMEPFYLAFYKERFLERITNTKTISIDSNKEEKYHIKLEKVK